jgi:hypothetical protein
MESFSLATRDKINTKIVYYFFMIGVELVYGLNKEFSGFSGYRCFNILQAVDGRKT